MARIMRYLPFASATTANQACTYLFAVCLFSISFLVFLNSSVSFVITDVIGVKNGVGDLVGTLGFVDELVALLACPMWGIASDRLGVRIVCVMGYLIVGIALLLFVQARNVYPQLLMARVVFSVGGAAIATMVTAILPSMTENNANNADIGCSNGNSDFSPPANPRHSVTPSVDSELTITPASFNVQPHLHRSKSPNNFTSASSPARLAGLVGVFTGCGALVALAVFLPLPAWFSHLTDTTQSQAVAYSFYVVGIISLFIAGFCALGLRGLQGEEGKGWKLLLGKAPNVHGYQGTALRSEIEGESPQAIVPYLPYWKLLLDSTVLGFKDAQIGLGYLGGFVARASSVGISLFIPLYVNAYFIRNGFCQGSPNDPSPELRKECRAAYVLAAELTGVSQVVALFCAPLFGFLSDRYRKFNIPLLTASGFGVIGYLIFANLVSPEPKDIDHRGGSPIVFLAVSMIGISQIGAIVCSLGLLGRGVIGDDGGNHIPDTSRANTDGVIETTPLFPSVNSERPQKSRSHLKGSIAGVYSLSGGAAILLLTKLGGSLFDSLSTGAPFYIMAIFNGVLLVVGTGVGLYQEFSRRRQ